MNLILSDRYGGKTTALIKQQRCIVCADQKRIEYIYR